MKHSALLIIAISAFLLNLSANAQSSFELTCRNQAKELAAETYKNCVTEHRQSQVEQIRKEYQQKLSDLKSHYDGELKKVSSGKAVKSVSKEISENKSGVMKRASGARELPEKKGSVAAKTEVIDFSKSSNTQQPSSDSSETTEIVEIPVE